MITALDGEGDGMSREAEIEMLNAQWRHPSAHTLPLFRDGPYPEPVKEEAPSLTPAEAELPIGTRILRAAIFGALDPPELDDVNRTIRFRGLN